VIYEVRLEDSARSDQRVVLFSQLLAHTLMYQYLPLAEILLYELAFTGACRLLACVGLEFRINLLDTLR